MLGKGVILFAHAVSTLALARGGFWFLCDSFLDTGVLARRAAGSGGA